MWSFLEIIFFFLRFCGNLEDFGGIFIFFRGIYRNMNCFSVELIWVKSFFVFFFNNWSIKGLVRDFEIL